MLFEIQILHWQTFHGISTVRYSGRPICFDVAKATQAFKLAS